MNSSPVKIGLVSMRSFHEGLGWIDAAYRFNQPGFRKKGFASSLCCNLERSVPNADHEDQGDGPRGAPKMVERGGALDCSRNTRLRSALRRDRTTDINIPRAGPSEEQGVGGSRVQAGQGEPLLYIPRQAPSNAGKTIGANTPRDRARPSNT